MKFTIIILFTLSCIHTLSRYSITDTKLGNVGLNVKPMPFLHLKTIENKIQKMGKSFDYDNEKVKNVIIEYTIKNINNIKHCYTWDIQYSLYKEKFLNDIKGHYINESEYHKIPLNIKYFDTYFDKIKKRDVSERMVYDKLRKNFYNNPNAILPAIAHFIKHVKAYLINEGILKSEKLSIEIEKDKKIIKALEKLRLENSAKHPENEAETLNEVPWEKTYEHVNKVGVKGMFLQKTSTKHKLDSIVTFFDIFNNKKIRYEDINDHMHPHMSLFSVLSILCSVAATFALFVTVAYHITKKKHQSDTTYTVMSMI